MGHLRCGSDDLADLTAGGEVDGVGALGAGADVGVGAGAGAGAGWTVWFSVGVCEYIKLTGAGGGG